MAEGSNVDVALKQMLGRVDIKGVDDGRVDAPGYSSASKRGLSSPATSSEYAFHETLPHLSMRLNTSPLAVYSLVYGTHGARR
jgi:hypothetical protein